MTGKIWEDWETRGCKKFEVGKTYGTPNCWGKEGFQTVYLITNRSDYGRVTIQLIWENGKQYKNKRKESKEIKETNNQTDLNAEYVYCGSRRLDASDCVEFTKTGEIILSEDSKEESIAKELIADEKYNEILNRMKKCDDLSEEVYQIQKYDYKYGMKELKEKNTDANTGYDLDELLAVAKEYYLAEKKLDENFSKFKKEIDRIRVETKTEAQEYKNRYFEERSE